MLSELNARRTLRLDSSAPSFPFSNLMVRAGSLCTVSFTRHAQSWESSRDRKHPRGLRLVLFFTAGISRCRHAEENGTTYAENAIAKARFYAVATGMCALADDSGLEVEALAGAPGVFSARYAGENASDADRRALLLSELAEDRNTNRRARFVAVVAISERRAPC